MPDQPMSPAEKLRHVLDLYPNRSDDSIAVEGSYNQHGDGARIDLTFGDLRAIADRLGA